MRYLYTGGPPSDPALLENWIVVTDAKPIRVKMFSAEAARMWLKSPGELLYRELQSRVIVFMRDHVEEARHVISDVDKHEILYDVLDVMRGDAEDIHLVNITLYLPKTDKPRMLTKDEKETYALDLLMELTQFSRQNRQKEYQSTYKQLNQLYHNGDQVYRNIIGHALKSMKTVIEDLE